jgi:hypothetical protein
MVAASIVIRNAMGLVVLVEYQPESKVITRRAEEQTLLTPGLPRGAA